MSRSCSGGPNAWIAIARMGRILGDASPYNPAGRRHAVDTSGIGIDVRDGVATLRMERERANAINPGTVEALTAAFAQVTEDRAVRAILLTSGRKLFSPGLDLAMLVQLDRPTMDRFMGVFSTW